MLEFVLNTISTPPPTPIKTSKFCITPPFFFFSSKPQTQWLIKVVCNSQKNHSKYISSNVLDTVSYQLKMHQHLSHSQPLQMQDVYNWSMSNVFMIGASSSISTSVIYSTSLLLDSSSTVSIPLLQTLWCCFNTFYRCVWSLLSSQMDSSCCMEGRSICCLELMDQQCCISINQENDQWVWRH